MIQNFCAKNFDYVDVLRLLVNWQQQKNCNQSSGRKEYGIEIEFTCSNKLNKFPFGLCNLVDACVSMCVFIKNLPESESEREREYGAY